MNYFDVLDILQTTPERRVTVTEAVSELSQKREVNAIAIRRAMLDLFLKHPQVYREMQSVKGMKGTGFCVYAYYYRSKD